MTSNIAEEIKTTFAFKTIDSLATNLWGVAFTVGALAAFGFLILGAIEWITGGGEKAKVEQARDKITQGMVGLGILAVSWALALLAQQFLGLNIFKGGGGNGDGGNGQYGCEQSQKNVTQCRNEDCQFYTCDGKYWIPQGNYETNFCTKYHLGCYIKPPPTP